MTTDVSAVKLYHSLQVVVETLKNICLDKIVLSPKGVMDPVPADTGTQHQSIVTYTVLNTECVIKTGPSSLQQHSNTHGWKTKAQTSVDESKLLILHQQQEK